MMPLKKTFDAYQYMFLLFILVHDVQNKIEMRNILTLWPIMLNCLRQDVVQYTYRNILQYMFCVD